MASVTAGNKDGTASSPTSNNQSALNSAMSGVFSGFLSTSLLHPIEVLKIRLQADVRNKQKRTLLDNLRMARYAGLYTGITPNVIASMMAWGIFFGLNDKFRSLFTAAFLSRRSADSSPDSNHRTVCYDRNLLTSKERFLVDFFASILASASAQVCTNPLWLMKTRMSLDRIPTKYTVGAISNAAETVINPNSPYNHLITGLLHTFKTEGIRGLYKGFSASLLGSMHGAIVMCTYEESKFVLEKLAERFTIYQTTPNLSLINALFTPVQPSSAQNIALQHENSVAAVTAVPLQHKFAIPSWFQTLSIASTSAVIAKVAATVATYPTQVIRTSIQDHRPVSTTSSSSLPPGVKYGIRSATRDIFTNSGFLGFYRGISMQIVRASLSNVIVFASYESMKRVLQPNNSSSSNKSQ